MSSLKAHPFVIQLRYAVRQDAHVYFVQDFAPGGDLYTLLRRFRIQAADVLFYAAEVALALEHCHGSNVVHRDLKPENVLVDQRGHVKLADFGLAKILPPGSDGTRTLCGTEMYAAPEMLRADGSGGKPYSFSVDFWGWGCLLFDMLSGRSPFDVGPAAVAGSSGAEAAAAARRQAARKLALAGRYTIPEHVPQPLRRLIGQVLVPDPAHRLGCAATPPLDAAAGGGSGARVAARDPPSPASPGAGWREVWTRPPFRGGVCREAALRGQLRPPVVNVAPGRDVLRNFEERFAAAAPGFAAGAGDGTRRQGCLPTPCEEALVGFYYPGV